MELQQLRSFLTIARLHSFNEAAFALHTSQPALSRQIASLEKELGTQLFIRGNRSRPLGLTPAGQRLYIKAKEIVNLADAVITESRQTPEIVGDIHIGLGESPGVIYLAKNLANLTAKHPRIRYRLHSGNSHDILERLETSALDFAITIGTDGPDHLNKLEIDFHDQWGIFLPRSNPLAENSTLSTAQISDLPLIISEQELDGGTLAGIFGKVWDDLHIVATYNLIHNALYLTAAGLGYTIGLAGLIPLELHEDVIFVPLDPPIKLNTYLLWQPNIPLTPQAEAFLSAMRPQTSQ